MRYRKIYYIEKIMDIPYLVCLVVVLSGVITTVLCIEIEPTDVHVYTSSKNTVFLVKLGVSDYEPLIFTESVIYYKDNPVYTICKSNCLVPGISCEIECIGFMDIGLRINNPVEITISFISEQGLKIEKKIQRYPEIIKNSYIHYGTYLYYNNSGQNALLKILPENLENTEIFSGFIHRSTGKIYDSRSSLIYVCGNIGDVKIPCKSEKYFQRINREIIEDSDFIILIADEYGIYVKKVTPALVPFLVEINGSKSSQRKLEEGKIIINEVYDTEIISGYPLEFAVIGLYSTSIEYKLNTDLLNLTKNIEIEKGEKVVIRINLANNTDSQVDIRLSAPDFNVIYNVRINYHIKQAFEITEIDSPKIIDFEQPESLFFMVKANNDTELEFNLSTTSWKAVFEDGSNSFRDLLKKNEVKNYSISITEINSEYSDIIVNISSPSGFYQEIVYNLRTVLDRDYKPEYYCELIADELVCRLSIEKTAVEEIYYAIFEPHIPHDRIMLGECRRVCEFSSEIFLSEVDEDIYSKIKNIAMLIYYLRIMKDNPMFSETIEFNKLKNIAEKDLLSDIKDVISEYPLDELDSRILGVVKAKHNASPQEIDYLIHSLIDIYSMLQNTTRGKPITDARTSIDVRVCNAPFKSEGYNIICYSDKLNIKIKSRIKFDIKAPETIEVLTGKAIDFDISVNNRMKKELRFIIEISDTYGFRDRYERYISGLGSVSIRYTPQHEGIYQLFVSVFPELDKTQKKMASIRVKSSKELRIAVDIPQSITCKVFNRLCESDFWIKNSGNDRDNFRIKLTQAKLMDDEGLKGIMVDYPQSVILDAGENKTLRIRVSGVRLNVSKEIYFNITPVKKPEASEQLVVNLVPAVIRLDIVKPVKLDIKNKILFINNGDSQIKFDITPLSDNSDCITSVSDTGFLIKPGQNATLVFTISNICLDKQIGFLIKYPEKEEQIILNKREDREVERENNVVTDYPETTYKIAEDKIKTPPSEEGGSYYYIILILLFILFIYLKISHKPEKSSYPRQLSSKQSYRGQYTYPKGYTRPRSYYIQSYSGYYYKK